jgi:hypothetical protein
MSAGQDEGVDQDGFVVSGVDADLIPVAYQPVLGSCVSTLVAAVDGLLAVYLYGSVATGRASPPESDIDLLVLTRDEASVQAIEGAARSLSRRYRRLAREVGVAHTTTAELFADDLDGLGRRCFLKHYCVPLHGDDIRDRLERCRPSATLAWAFNHNVDAAIEGARRRLAAANDGDDVEVVGRAVARKLLLAAASLTSVITGSWTTDRRRAAAAISEHYPRWADQAATALAWASTPTDNPSEVTALLDGFATWVARELRAKADPDWLPGRPT